MFQLHHLFGQAVDMGSQTHVVLEVFKVVTHEVGDGMILFLQFVLQYLVATLQGKELLLEGLNTSKLFGLHDHRIVYAVHPIFSLSSQIS